MASPKAPILTIIGIGRTVIDARRRHFGLDQWIRDSTTGETIRRLLPSRDDWLVPAIIQLELVKWIKRQGYDEISESVIAFSEKCHVVGLDMPLALSAADAGVRHQLSTADAIIYATADAYDADILTCDAHFNDLPRGMFVAKSADRA